MDKYTKCILTIIAVGIIGINFQMFGDNIISPAYANSPVQKVQICDSSGEKCVSLSTDMFGKSRLMVQ